MPPCTRTLPFAPDLVLEPLSRSPLRLPAATVRGVLNAPLPFSTANRDLIPRSARVSIVIVTFNNLVVTRLCMESVLANTDHEGLELVVVDNASTDATREYLRAVAANFPFVRLIENEENRGFARANNQGLALAKGDLLVLLNNDTIVPRGWLPRLLRHLDDEQIGLLGPVTNRIGNEAEIPVPYTTYGGFEEFAEKLAQEKSCSSFEAEMPAMFCLAMRRDVFERLGPIDERFEVGMFEDDDYVRRAQQAGYRTVCAEDVFVHHFGQASFGELIPSGHYGELFRANRRRFEEKWGTTWQPHSRRAGRDYRGLLEHIRTVALTAIPPGATVAVISRGDAELLSLNGRTGWHFPQAPDGGYAGHYPADDQAAISALEGLRQRGAEFLLIPRTSTWWLDHYAGFADHLRLRYQETVGAGDAYVLFDLRAYGPESPTAAPKLAKLSRQRGI